jgi:hypothetical protein
MAFSLLVKCIGKMLRIYGGKRFEFPAVLSQVSYTTEDTGDFEIAYKRSALMGTIPTDISFTLTRDTGEQIEVRKSVNHLGSRKDLTGSRIVPIAAFTIQNKGTYLLSIPSISGVKEKDKLQIGHKTGSRGFMMILATVCLAIVSVAGFVLSILAFTGKL